jgi:hypothetical protein
MGVFISHARSDEECARRLAESIEKHSIRTWLGERDLQAGESIGDAVGRALHQSEAVVFLIGPQANPEQWQRYEWSLALELAWSDPRGKRLIPVLIGGAILPSFLEDRRSITVQSQAGDWDAAAREVIQALQQDPHVDEDAEPSSVGASDRWLARLNELQQGTNTLRSKGSSF